VRTLKEQLLSLQGYGTVEGPGQALRKLGERYERDWFLERHAHRLPAVRRAALAARGEDTRGIHSLDPPAKWGRHAAHTAECHFAQPSRSRGRTQAVPLKIRASELLLRIGNEFVAVRGPNSQPRLDEKKRR